MHGVGNDNVKHSEPVWSDQPRFSRNPTVRLRIFIIYNAGLVACFEYNRSFGSGVCFLVSRDLVAFGWILRDSITSIPFIIPYYVTRSAIPRSSIDMIFWYFLIILKELVVVELPIRTLLKPSSTSIQSLHHSVSDLVPRRYSDTIASE